MSSPGPVYTHAMWLVRAGNEEAFIEQWTKLSELFSQLERKPLWGTLIRSTFNTRLFYSFGPWASEDDIAAMRSHPDVHEVFGDLMSLCDEASPGSYELVKHVE